MSSNITVTRICIQCQKEFTAHTTTTTCCSDRCRGRYYKARVRAAKISASNQELNAHREIDILEIRKKELFTVKDLARLLTCGEDSVYLMIKNAEITVIRLSPRKIRIHRKEFQAYLERKKVAEIILPLLIKEVAPEKKTEAPSKSKARLNRANAFTINDLVKDYFLNYTSLSKLLKKHQIQGVKDGRDTLVPTEATLRALKDIPLRKDVDPKNNKTYDPSLYYTIDEVAELKLVSRNTVRLQAERKGIKFRQHWGFRQ